MESILVIRPTEGRILGGVCAGLADRWVIDRNLLRVAFALLGIASGAGVVIYLALWLTWPDDRGRVGTLWHAVHGNAKEIGVTAVSSAHSIAAAWGQTEQSQWPRPLTRRWLGAGLVLAGLWLMLGSLGLFEWLGVGTSVGIASMIIGVALIKSMAPPAKERV